MPQHRREVNRMNFEAVKKNYQSGLWSAALVKMAVRKGIITKEQYTEITGKPYPEAGTK